MEYILTKKVGRSGMLKGRLLHRLNVVIDGKIGNTLFISKDDWINFWWLSTTTPKRLSINPDVLKYLCTIELDEDTIKIEETVDFYDYLKTKQYEDYCLSAYKIDFDELFGG